MKFKVKDMDIATGGILIALINQNDAAKLDLHHEDRIKLKKGSKEVIAVIDIGESKKAVPKGRIGLFEEVLDELNAKQNDTVQFFYEKKPESIQHIKKKLDKQELNEHEINEIITDIVQNRLTSLEITYFVSACYMNGISSNETKLLTMAMVNTGEKLDTGKPQIFDKHCVGGVAGNRTTMVVVPILAAAGLTMPKTSSRSITSPSGTADTMEVLANVSLSINQIKYVVQKTNACIVWGGALKLAPADDKIIRVETPLSIDAEGQMLASILAKKKAVGATHVLIDIPTGKGAKVENKSDALKLKQDFENIGNAVGMKIKAITTDGTQPIGNGIGPALEARDALWILKNDSKAPFDLREKCLMMAGILLEMAEKAKPGKGKQLAEELLKTGAAYNKMVEIIKAQKAKTTEPDKIKLGKYKFDYAAKQVGIIQEINNKIVSKIARIAGAPQDQGAGIYLYNHVGERVDEGELLFTIYADNKEHLEFAKEIAETSESVKIKG